MNNSRNFLLGILVLSATFVFLFMSCEKGTESVVKRGSLKIYLTDTPLLYEEVDIEVSEVSVHFASPGDTIGGSWKVVNAATQVYDLLALTNGASAVLGEAQLEAGHYTQLRLKVTSACRVKVDGVFHDLQIPSGLETGIKLNHEFDLEPNKLYELILDFDAHKSVIKTGNGNYILKPTIRVIPEVISGTILGTIIPAEAKAKVSAIAGLDTVNYAFADTLSGAFTVAALPEGNYSVHIGATVGAYQDTLLTDVAVTAGNDTDIGTITLHQ